MHILELDKNPPIQPNKQEDYQIYKKFELESAEDSPTIEIVAPFDIGTLIYVTVNGIDDNTYGAFLLTLTRANNAYATMGKVEQGVTFQSGTNKRISLKLFTPPSPPPFSIHKAEVTIRVIQNLTE